MSGRPTCGNSATGARCGFAIRLCVGLCRAKQSGSDRSERRRLSLWPSLSLPLAVRVSHGRSPARVTLEGTRQKLQVAREAARLARNAEPRSNLRVSLVERSVSTSGPLNVHTECDSIRSPKRRSFSLLVANSETNSDVPFSNLNERFSDTFSHSNE